jgi:hypothetical protein
MSRLLEEIFILTTSHDFEMSNERDPRNPLFFAQLCALFNRVLPFGEAGVCAEGTEYCFFLNNLLFKNSIIIISQK